MSSRIAWLVNALDECTTWVYDAVGRVTNLRYLNDPMNPERGVHWDCWGQWDDEIEKCLAAGGGKGSSKGGGTGG